MVNHRAQKSPVLKDSETESDDNEDQNKNDDGHQSSRQDWNQRREATEHRESIEDDFLAGRDERENNVSDQMFYLPKPVALAAAKESSATSAPLFEPKPKNNDAELQK